MNWRLFHSITCSARAGWFAFIVPAGTPKEIITLLHREIVKIIALPEVKEKMATLGFEAVYA